MYRIMRESYVIGSSSRNYSPPTRPPARDDLDRRT